MNETLIRQIANEILLDTIIQNWLTYAVLAALFIIFGAASGFASNYLQKRAQNLATKADFEELLRQLKITTEATESVKVAIAKNDLNEREWRTIRKIKLEELIIAIYDTAHWLNKESDLRFFGGSTISNLLPIWKVEALSNLYFTELVQQVNIFKGVFLKYNRWILQVHCQLQSAGNDTNKSQQVMNLRIPEWIVLNSELDNEIKSLSKSSSDLMKVICDI